MNKRHWTSLLLAGLLLLPLAACGKKDPGGISSRRIGHCSGGARAAA